MALGDRRARVRPTIVPLQQVNPRDASSGIPEALASIANAGLDIHQNNIRTNEQIEQIDHKVKMREHRRKQQSTIADGLARWAALKSEITVWNEEKKANAEKGAADYEDALDVELSEKLKVFQGTLGNDEEVQQRFSPLVAGFDASLRGKAKLWSAAKRSEAMKLDSDAWLQTTANGFADTPDAGDYEQALKEWAMLVNSREGVDGNGEKELNRYGAQRLSVAFFDGLVANGKQDEADALLSRGLFDGIFDNKQKTALRRQAALAQDRAQREAKLEVTLAQNAIEDEIDRVELRIKNGLPVSEAEFRGLQKGAATTGLNLEADQLEIWRQQALANDSFRNMGVSELKASKRALQAKVDAEGRAAKPGDILALDVIDGFVDRKEDEAAEEFKQGFAQGAAGQIDVASALQQRPMKEAIETARRLDPKGTFQYSIQLHPGLMSMERVGAAERAANPELVPTPKDLNKAFQKGIGRAGLLISGDQMSGIREVAANLYAAAAKKNGWKDFRADEYNSMISSALGKRSGAGGLGVDIRNRELILPSGVEQSAFQKFQARHDYAGAAESAEVVKKYFSPVWHNDAGGGSIYVLVNNRGERLQSKKGGDYYWKVSKGGQ